MRLESGLFHRPRNGFSASVHHHRIDLYGFEKNNVARDGLPYVRVGRIHKTAPIFDYESRAAELLNIGQRLEQHSRFSDEVLHNQPPSDPGSLTSPLLNSTYASVKSAAYISALALPRFKLMCRSNSVAATAAHSSWKLARVGCPRFRLQRILRLPGPL